MPDDSPKLPRIAAWIAFAMAGLIALSALMATIALLPTALVPLFAGIGIMRCRVWSAFGFATYILGQVLLVPTVVLLIASAVFSVAVGIFFIFAGRSLAASGAARGRAWPWIAVTALVTLPLFFFQPFLNPTGSMEDTLLVGDHFFVQRFPRPNVTRGDIIAFLYPVDPKQTFIKRIVGIPGDRIRIVNKVLYRNGERLNEPWVSHKLDYIDSYRDGFPSEPNTALFPLAQTMLAHHVVDGEVVVPAGNFFVLGDNRDQSLDSRYWGFVSFANVIGKPVLIYDSVEETTQPPARHIRWNRLFRLL